MLKVLSLAFMAAGLLLLSPPAAAAQEQGATTVGQRILGASTVHVAQFALPPSDSLDKQSLHEMRWWADLIDSTIARCPNFTGTYRTTTDVLNLRRCMARAYFPPILAKLRSRFNVHIERQEISNVPIEIFLPAGGVRTSNLDRVLINIHGGSFTLMGRWGGEVESIPIASTEQIKVVSVDYRMAPEAHFPAASEDVAAVYRWLLRTYRPENIGIYGCSAGGILTGESIAWFDQEHLPQPGAIGIFCAGLERPSLQTDSVRIAKAIQHPLPTKPGDLPPNEVSYFSEADSANPLAFPGIDLTILSKFPPTLLISGTRDAMMSSVVITHEKLVGVGVDAELHVWEGMGHGFFFDPDLVQSEETYRVIAHFFDEKLGQPRASVP